MVEISYQLPAHEGSLLGLIWIRITTRVPSVVVDAILQNNNIVPMERDYGYTIHELEFDTLIEIRYPFQNEEYPIYSIWKSVEEIALMEFE